MGFPKFTVLIVAALALAGLGVAAVAPGSLIDSGEAPLSLTVPLAQIGDRIVYEWYEESLDELADHRGDGLVEVRALHLERLDTTLDWTGATRDVVVVASTSWTIDPANGTQSEPLPGPVRHVDRTERISVGIDWFEGDGSSQDGGLNVSLMRPGGSGFPYVELQGATLTHGQETTLAPGFSSSVYGFGGGVGAAGGGDFPVDLGVPQPQSRSMSFSLRNDVSEIQREPATGVVLSEVATIEGHEAIGFRIEDDGPTDPGDDPERRHPAWAHGEPARWSTTETVWFTEAAPGPILIEMRAEVHDVNDNVIWWATGTRWLAEYEPGQGGPAWGVSHDREPHVPERGGDTHYPADGDGSGLSFPLSQAIREAHEFAPIGFVLWKQEHPVNHLVAATMTPGSHDGLAGSSFEWRLSFAEPSGAGIQVLIERADTAIAPYVETMPEFDAHAFDPDGLPKDLVTLAQVERYWRAFDSESGLSFVHWGFVDVPRATSASCMMGGTHTSGDDTDPAEQLRRVQLGSTTLGPCLQSDDESHLIGVVADVDRGHLLASFELSHEWEADEGLAREASGPSRAVIAATGGQGPPTVLFASLASSSLLLIILTVYLLPHLKWFVTQSLLLVPGFSRLKKDKLLDHKMREQLNEAIKTNPGVSPSELQRQTGAGWGTVVHHLTVLEKNGLVTSAIDGRRRRYFPHLPGGESVAKREAVLANENTQRILSIVMAEPGIPTSAIAGELGMSTAGAMWHLGRLEEAGFVDRQKEGRRVRYFPGQPSVMPARPYNPDEAVEVA